MLRFCLMANKTAKNIMNKKPIKSIRKNEFSFQNSRMLGLTRKKGIITIAIIPIRIIATAIN